MKNKINIVGEVQGRVSKEIRDTTYPSGSNFARHCNDNTYEYGPKLRFKNCKFENKCSFDGCVFESCTFGKTCSFTDCTFSTETNISCAHFHVCTFARKCSFSHCDFMYCSVASGSLFEHGEIEGGDWAPGCRFEGVTFKPYTSLGRHNNFKDCLFHHCVSFGWGCTYEGDNHGLINLLAQEHRRIGELLAAEQDRVLGSEGGAAC